MRACSEQSGFGNEFATEAVAGALPQARSCLLRQICTPGGLGAAAFTAARATHPRW